MLKNKSKGMWTDFMTGIFVIAAVTVCYIILQQVYEADIKPYSVREGSDPTNMNYIEIAWDFWPVPVLIGFLFMLVKAGYDGRKSAVDVYE